MPGWLLQQGIPDTWYVLHLPIAVVYSPPPFLPHLKGENILRVELDMPNRITRDYEYPSVAPSLKAALNRAMSEEEELTVDAR